MSLRGADTGRLLEIEQSLSSLIERLIEAESAGHRLVSGVRSAWIGSDAERFSAEWSGHDTAALVELRQAVTAARDTIRRNRQAQDETSASLDGAGNVPHSGVPFTPVVPGTVDRGRVDDAASRVTNLLNPAWFDLADVTHRDLDEIKDTIESLNPAERVALIQSLSNEDLQILLDEINGGRAGGGYVYPASKAEFWSLVMPYLDIEDKRRIFGEEWAQAGEPVRYGSVERAEFVSGMLRDMSIGSDSGGMLQDEIEIRSLDNGRFVVVLPGVTDLSDAIRSVNPLELNSPSDYGSARDTRYATDSLRSSVNSSETGANAYAFAIKEAMLEAGVPDGAEVMLVGHSFGSMTATDLAGDRSFNDLVGGPSDGYSVKIDTVVATGAYSPQSVDRVPAQESVALLNLQNSNDAAVNLEHADLGRHDVLAGVVGDDHRSQVFAGGLERFGHGEENYANFVDEAIAGTSSASNPDTNSSQDVAAFNSDAADRYNDSGTRVRVKVKDAYSDPRITYDPHEQRWYRP